MADRYVKVEKGRSGGMGTATKVHDRTLGVYRALKEMAIPDFATTAGRAAFERFKREADIVARLQHKNIARLHHRGRTERHLFIVFDWVDGSDLAGLLRRRGALTLTRAVRIMADILSALEYGADAGVTHRDLKPGNVMLTKRGRAVLVDYGVARTLGSQLTETNIIVGSLRYLAPEQIYNPKIVGPPSDVYAAGVLLHTMLAGKPPFDGPVEAVLRSIQADPLPLLSGTVPLAVQDVIALATAKDPSQRYTAKLFREALRDAMAGTADTVVAQAPVAGGGRRSSVPAPIQPSFGALRAKAGAVDMQRLATGACTAFAIAAAIALIVF